MLAQKFYNIKPIKTTIVAYIFNIHEKPHHFLHTT